MIRSDFLGSSDVHCTAAGVRRPFSIPGRHVRFCAVSMSCVSAKRVVGPKSFPWLAVIPNNFEEKLNEIEEKVKEMEDKGKGKGKGQGQGHLVIPQPRWEHCIHDCHKDKGNVKFKLSFLSHVGNGCGHEFHIACDDIDLHEAHFRNMDDCIMFVCKNNPEWSPSEEKPEEIGMPVIFNPFTGSQTFPFPSLDTLCDNLYCQLEHFEFVVFLADNVAFVECCINRTDHILAAASPGDYQWSFINLSSSFYLNGIASVVFHEADHKFYYMDWEGEMQSFRLIRCGSKTVFDEVSSILAKAKATAQQVLLFESHLVSHGTNLWQVRRRRKTNAFDILKYHPDADMWVEEPNMDLGNNSLFFDWYGAKLLPLPLSQGDGYLQRKEEEEGRPRRNCIYFTDYVRNPSPPEGCKQYVHYVRVYDVGKGTVEPCFSTNIQSDYHLLPALMWFMPSPSVNN